MSSWSSLTCHLVKGRVQYMPPLMEKACQIGPSAKKRGPLQEALSSMYDTG